MKDKKELIIKFLSNEAKRPLSFKEITRALQVPREDHETLKHLLRELIEAGTLIKVRGGRYGLPEKMNLLTGTLECHSNGFGFVIPEEGGEDIFINRSGVREAMHGDTVVARVDGVKEGGKREGKIVRIIKRAHRTLIGRFERVEGAALVVPSNERILQEVMVSPKKCKGAKHGELVEVEITRWPAKHMPPLGVITDVLGNAEDPEVEIEVITRKYALPHKFPNPVINDAEKIPLKVSKEDIEGRIDLRRGIKLFTIDGETAKDFDDAVGIERLPTGYRLLVAIADVSHYVKEGSLIDTEAYVRSTSVYFPGYCIPMLPEALSNNICSLMPRVDRLALTAELIFDDSGKLKKKSFFESVIKSAERLTYTDVRKILKDKDRAAIKKFSQVTDELRTMEELARKLAKNRQRDGSIDFDLPEPQIIIDLEGNIEDIVRSERNIAHRIIEEFMLSANRAVATEFIAKKVPAIFRVHEEPDSENIKDFKEFAAGLGYHFKGEGPKAFQKTLKHFEGRPEERLINHILLRSMKQARYAMENTGHFGLAFEKYTHFTSPIRRYPDLIVHRLIKRVITNSYDKKLRDRMEALLPDASVHTSAKERKAMEAEREIVDLKKAQFMKDRVGEDFDGFISGVTSFGLFVELKDYFVEGLIHITSLDDDYYNYLEKKHMLIGESTKKSYSLGAPLRVTIKMVDLERRRIDLALIEDDDEKKKPQRSPRKARDTEKKPFIKKYKKPATKDNKKKETKKHYKKCKSKKTKKKQRS
jgi:ribonuclease R